ncbi:MAG: hypothetical protein ACI4EG_09685 [Fusicatenibacter sp.]
MRMEGAEIALLTAKNRKMTEAEVYDEISILGMGAGECSGGYG